MKDNNSNLQYQSYLALLKKTGMPDHSFRVKKTVIKI